MQIVKKGYRKKRFHINCLENLASGLTQIDLTSE